MKKFSCFAALILLAWSFGLRADEPAEATDALPIRWTQSEAFDSLPKELKNQIVSDLNEGFVLMQLHPPKTDHLFSWKGSRENLKGKSHTFHITTSIDPVLKKLPDLPGGIPPSSDAFTLTLVNRETKEIKITTTLLVDRLLIDYVKDPKTKEESAVWREDGVSRVAIVLAHEVYGNTQTFLETDPKVKQTLESRKAGELRAFRAGIEYIDRVLAPDSELQKLPASVAKDAMLRDHRSLRKQEEAMLESWEKAKTK